MYVYCMRNKFLSFFHYVYGNYDLLTEELEIVKVAIQSMLLLFTSLIALAFSPIQNISANNTVLLSYNRLGLLLLLLENNLIFNLN